MYKPAFHNGTKRKKLDYEGSKRLVHIYGVGEKKFGQTKNMVWMVNQGYSLVIVYFDFM